MISCLVLCLALYMHCTCKTALGIPHFTCCVPACSCPCSCQLVPSWISWSLSTCFTPRYKFQCSLRQLHPLNQPQRFISSLLGIYCTSYVQSPKRRTQYRWGSFSSFHHCSLLGEKTKSSARHGFEALLYSWNCKSVDNNHVTARIKNLKS